MPNVRRYCQTTDSQPSVTDGDESPAAASTLRGEPGEDIPVSHLCKGYYEVVTVSPPHCVYKCDMSSSSCDNSMSSCSSRVNVN